MKRKITKSKPRELTISSAELSRFGMGVMKNHNQTRKAITFCLSFQGEIPPFHGKCVLQNAQAEGKIIFRQTHYVNHQIVPVNEDEINQSFESVNDSFGGFREFTSDLFFQIIDFVTPLFKNLFNGEIF